MIQDEGAPTTVGVQYLNKIHVIPDEEQLISLSAQDELNRWHHSLGHLPYK